jgi:hypothetical protein
MIPRLCPHFRRFLSERNLLIQFHINMILYWFGDWKGFIKARKSLATCKSYALNIAFNWFDTPEGGSFWTSIDRKWDIHYQFLLSGGVIKEQAPLSNDTKCNK